MTKTATLGLSARFELLRSGELSGLDVENLIEAIESLGRHERQELRNRLGVLLGHLLTGPDFAASSAR